MSVHPLSPEQTIDILTGPREIPAEVTGRVETMLNDGTPSLTLTASVSL